MITETLHPKEIVKSLAAMALAAGSLVMPATIEVAFVSTRGFIPEELGMPGGEDKGQPVRNKQK